MNTNTQNYYNQYCERLSKNTEDELISTFNQEVGNSGWGTARASFLSAIHNEFEIRGFDYSLVGDRRSLSFNKPILLYENKIIVVLKKD